MGKILLDRRGTLRQGAYWQFNIPFDDATDSLPPEADWIIVPRTPTNDRLAFNGEPTYLWLEDLPLEEDAVETKDCKANTSHVTHRYYRKVQGDAAGGSRLAPFIPATNSMVLAVSSDFRRNIDGTKLRGARFDRFEITVNQSGLADPKAWAFQFVGKADLRPPKFFDAPNRCPYCGKGIVLCESCGQLNPNCLSCQKPMIIIETKHGGKDDKRIPFEDGCWWRIIEGKSWDGSDLVQAHGRTFASRRFIDWLLKVHAAPFYAEPVWFCVDGMNEQQKIWFDEIQKPFEL